MNLPWDVHVRDLCMTHNMMWCVSCVISDPSNTCAVPRHGLERKKYPLRKGQLLVKLGPYHAEPHEAEATPKANNVRTETPYPYLPPKVELVISPPTAGSGGPLPPPSGAPFVGAGITTSRWRLTCVPLAAGCKESAETRAQSAPTVGKPETREALRPRSLRDLTGSDLI